MKFAHFADCHIGGWREPELKKLSIESFKKAVEICIERHTAFVLIAGDLFNTALPDIDLLKATASILRKLKSKNISTYIIAGSHDFSPSGKTMIDVLEKAGLVKNVVRFKDNRLQFTIDKTQTKITGFLGKKGGLEMEEYKTLQKEHLESETGFKIFMFHTTLEEFKPQDMERVQGLGVVSLPKNFNYYAGGHVHYIFQTEYGNGKLAYPGALFPNNFKELEEFKHGSFYIIDDQVNIEQVPVKLKDVLTFKFNADSKTPEILQKEILETLRQHIIKDKILTIRIAGTLSSGKPSDLNLKEIFKHFKDAYIILKNISKLKSKEFEEQEIEQGSNIEEVEDKIIKEHLKQIEVADLDEKKEELLTKQLIASLDIEKEEGEKNIDFEKRVIKNAVKILDLEEIWNG